MISTPILNRIVPAVICLVFAGSFNASQAGEPVTTFSYKKQGDNESLRLQAAANSYKSAWAEMFPESLPRAAGGNMLAGQLSQSRILDDFHSAAGSTNLRAAELRWQNFLRKYVLPGGEYEDGTAAHLCEWSRGELERCQKLSQGRGGEVGNIERKLRAVARKLGVNPR